MDNIIGKLKDLPTELKDLKNWLITKDKLPSVKWSDPENLVDFKDIMSIASKKKQESGSIKGILPAFPFLPNVNYIGIDFDAHKSEDMTEEEFQAILTENQRLIDTYFKNKPCYIEISSGGLGYHVICKVDKPELYTTFKAEYEMKTSQKISYLCISGKITQAPECLEPMDADLLQFLEDTNHINTIKGAENLSNNDRTQDLAELPTNQAEPKEKAPNFKDISESFSSIRINKNTRTMTSEELLEFLLNHKTTGRAFRDLFNGNWWNYSSDGSQSSADQKFFYMCYYWNQDREVARRIYEKSKLYFEGTKYNEDGTVRSTKNQPHYFYFSWDNLIKANLPTAPLWSESYSSNISTNENSEEAMERKLELCEEVFQNHNIQNFINNYVENRDRAVRKYPTGINSFDILTKEEPKNDAESGGFETGLNMIVAPSGFGKSLFMVQSAEYIAKTNKDAIVLYFNLEMDPVRLCRNNLIRFTHTETIGDFNDNVILNSYASTYNNLYFMPNSCFNFEDIMDLVEYAKNNICENVVIFIDYFQKIQSRDPRAFNTRREFLEFILLQFKIYGNNNQASFIIASNMAKSQLTEVVDETSGKETGDVIFSCDNYFGIDLNYKYSTEFNKQKGETKTKALASENIMKAKSCDIKLMRFRKFKGRDGRQGGESLFYLIGKEKRLESIEEISPYDTTNMKIEEYQALTYGTKLILNEFNQVEVKDLFNSIGGNKEAEPEEENEEEAKLPLIKL